MWVCAFTQVANTAAFSLVVGIKGCSWLSVGFECWAGGCSREHWSLLNYLTWGWEQSFCLVDGAVFQSKMEWSVEPGQRCAEGCVGCLVAVIAIFACSECSSGFLREDHPHEQDKASEACAGETYSYRTVYTSVQVLLCSALCSLCRTAALHFFATSLTLNSKSYFCQLCRNPCYGALRM